MTQNKNGRINIRACFRTGKRVHMHLMMYGGAELELHSFLTLALDGVGSQLRSSSAVPKEGLPVPWVAPGRFVKEKNFLPLSWIEPRFLDCTAHTAVTLPTISCCLITIKYVDISNLNVSWMRYDTARKERCLWNRYVILKGMTFHWLNPSGSTAAFGSTTHPLTEV
jgi:hypothetical protein